MRTLNRPMFRYGGPIKEGVMNGIREPRKNGGSMANNEGPRRAALVGNNIFPKTDGRENHLIQFPIGAAVMTGIGAAARAGARYIPRGINYLKNLGRTRTGSTTSTVPKQGPTFPGRTTTTQGGFGAPVTTRAGTPIGPGSATIETSTYAPNFLGRDPLIQVGGKLVNALVNPTTGGLISKGARVVFSPSGAIIGGLYYANGKFFNKKGEEVEKPEGDIKIGGTADIKGGGADSEPKVLSEAEREAATIASRKKQMDMYKEIMDIKGMKKDATYKALIDASQLITSEGDFKGSIKDGSLIAKLIGAADKRFDKVSDTETALRSLIAKGEIEKDMNKEKNALDNKKTNLQIKAAEKTLAGASLAETANAVYEKTGKFPKGNDLANVARTKGIEVVGIEDSTAVENWIGENGGDEITYMQDIIARGIDVAPGPHVLRSRIILVDSEGNVSPYF